MSDSQPSFEHEALEADIKLLVEEVKRHREAPENQSVGDKELLKHAISSLPFSAGQEIKQAPQTKPQPKSPLPSYAQSAPAEVKLEIEYLLDVAFHQGIAKANGEARKSSDFILDAFHDALAGKLYSEFQKRGLLN